MSNRAIFLDRDNTIIEDPGYISDPSQVKLVDGVAEALIELRAMGYKLIVVSNQSAVARGIVTEKTLGEIHDRVKQLLGEKGASLDAIYYCPYHPDGAVTKYRKESDWRKPKPGMLLAAAKEMDVDLSQSWMIGDRGRDIEAGLQAGCRTILIGHQASYEQTDPTKPKPDHRAVNMKEAVNIVKQHHRLPKEPTDQAPPALIEQAQEPEQLPEEARQAESTVVEEAPEQQKSSGATVERLLGDILDQLKTMQRTELFGEFSVMRFLAGLVQIVVPLCLLIAIFSVVTPGGQDSSPLIALGFAAVLQLMSLTFYMMQGRK
jgi:D-glycero-D-manno-heptose 1,7-bisphosphate phosphatase